MTIDLEAIRARCEAATKGPWGVYHDRDSGWVVNEARYEVCTVGHHKEAEADAQFITSSRSDVPALLGLVDQLTKALLQAEWSDIDDCDACPCCRFGKDQEALDDQALDDPGHGDGCPLSEALSAVGLDTQEKRDAARKAGR